MPDTVFYSWQSDRPNSTNRGFIEDALEKAIRELGQDDNELYKPPRAEVELDKDTKGVSGSPPIADTIFKKIEECAVFVPDLTFCGETKRGRPMPNPNVLIEYGWALAKLGPARIVGVMNSAHGRPSSQSLPFNMRHLRWPHDFCLQETDSPEVRQSIKSDLVGFFKGALADARRVPAIVLSSFAPMEPKHRISSFLGNDEVLGILQGMPGFSEDTKITWHNRPQLFLRVVPTNPVGPFTPFDIEKMMEERLLIPFGGCNITRRSMGNEWGFVVFGPDTTDQKPDSIVQVFRQGEIWGIDNYTLQQANSVRFFENQYASALAQYIQFSKEQLGVTSPVTVMAGMTEVQGFQLHLPSPPQGKRWLNDPVGRAATDDIDFTITDVSLEPSGDTGLEFDEGYVLKDDVHFRHAYKTLLPFFDKVWGEFQQERPKHLPKLLNQLS